MKVESIILSSLTLISTVSCNQKEESKSPTNVLLITVDDMNYNSIGSFGCKIPNTTPNIDKLASQGKRFSNAHVQVAVCQPCRNSIATGMYPHKSGLKGFFPLPDTSSIPLVFEILKQNGFITGILGKVGHSTPRKSFQWDLKKDMDDLGHGRNPDLYYSYAKQFFNDAKESGKPFYFMTNSHDPHRPFYGSEQESTYWNEETFLPSKVYNTTEVDVPAFLPELPDVRLEMAEYYSSVRRADDVIGKILLALKESGLEENTLVVFISDHGMALPFAKTNCYLNSTKTPMIVRWPGKVEANTLDTENFISTIDFLPTFLEVNQIDVPENVDGRSIVPVLQGEIVPERNKIYTQFFETSAKNAYPMRALQNKKYGYIFNPWSDGERVFKNESQSGRTFNAMKEAAITDSAIAARVDLFVHRQVEEFYDFEKDPDALTNLIDHPEYQEEIDNMRAEMENWMRTEGDDALEAFVNRADSITLRKYVLNEDKIAKKRLKKKH